LKRLKYYLLNQKNSKNYNDIYEGEMVMPAGVNTEYHNDPTYWDEEIAYSITRTNKTVPDKPTVEIKIPIEQILKKDMTLLDDLHTYHDAIADCMLRMFIPYIKELNELNDNRSRTYKENGHYFIYEPNGKILKRNSSYFKMVNRKYYILRSNNTISIPESSSTDKQPKNCICFMLQVQFPYNNVKKTMQMLTKDLPNAVDSYIAQFDTDKLNIALPIAKQQTKIRQWLSKSEYCAFIANGSILPRFKGTDLPLDTAIPFVSPKNTEIEIAGIKGMGIKRGVTIITGGGYSGKSTVLDALSSGIYNHINGDGRDLVITDETAVKISAEDGRSVKNVNISPFIKWLPNGDTSNFSTEHASGSTSQAANIMEAVNGGSKLLLIDEDKSATNFMIRDSVMKKLIEKEPITPFTDRVNELYNHKGVSTILVIGGSSEYLSVADRVYMMDNFMLFDVTDKAKTLCMNLHNKSEIELTSWEHKRTLQSEGFSPYPKNSGTERLEVSELGFIKIGDETINITMLHDIVTNEQINALAFIVRKLEISKSKDYINRGTPCVSLEKNIEDLYMEIENNGIDIVYSNFFTGCDRFLDLPRKQEVLSVINRMRKISFIK
jgi:hypothetical protein